MNTLILRAYLFGKYLLEREEGQDLVEYALIVALIAFGAINGMHFLSAGINRAFSNIANTLNSNI
jgi:pilus assembly protein Flp/PilA